MFAPAAAASAGAGPTAGPSDVQPYTVGYRITGTEMGEADDLLALAGYTRSLIQEGAADRLVHEQRTLTAALVDALPVGAAVPMNIGTVQR